MGDRANYVGAVGCVAAEPQNIGTVIVKLRPSAPDGRSGLSDSDSGYLPAPSNCPFQVATGVFEERKVVDVIRREDVATVKLSRTTIVAGAVGIRGSIKIRTLLLRVDLVRPGIG